MANEILFGFRDLAYTFSQRVDTVGVDTIATAIAATLAEHNRQMAALMSLFVEPTTDFQQRYKTTSAARLQPIAELGRARPVLPAGAYTAAWPLQMGAHAIGLTYEDRIKMTVGEANEMTAQGLTADFRWMREHILAGLFYDAGGDGTGWTYTDVNDDVGALNILGLADGDTQVYNVLGGADNGAVDDHLLAQASAIDDSNNPFPTISSELTEHSENGGEVVVIIPTGLKASIEALSTYYARPDQHIQSGIGVSQLVGSLDVPVPGKVIGYVDGCWIVEWRSMVANYMFATTTQGNRPLRMRQESVPELQGFRLVAERNDHPFFESQWRRKAGFGAWNRVGGLVMRIGNASYAVPTGFESPLA